MKTTKKTVKANPKKLSISAPAPKKEKFEYSEDFYNWANKQAALLKNGEFSKLDMVNLVEEIESLGRSERRTLQSYLEILLMHMLKVKYQPSKHTRSWDLSIKEAGYKVEKTLSKNTSLKPELKEILEESYFSARIKAALETGLPEETFPEQSPWKLKDIFPELEKKYL